MIKMLIFLRFCCVLWADHNNQPPYFICLVAFYDKDIDISLVLLHSLGWPQDHHPIFRSTCFIVWYKWWYFLNSIAFYGPATTTPSHISFDLFHSMIVMLIFPLFCCVLWAGHNTPTPYFIWLVTFYDSDVDILLVLLHSMGWPQQPPPPYFVWFVAL